MANLAVNIASLNMKNPITVASGTFGSGIPYSDFVDVAKLGAVTTKGTSNVSWRGNESPRMAEVYGGMLNSIGLQNPGAEALVEDLEWLKDKGATVIVNVCGHSISEYVDVVRRLDGEYVHAFELNLSCPNVDAGGMTLGTDPKMIEEVVSACVCETNVPVIAKLTPNVACIADLARAAEAGGAAGVSAINTLLGMAIDVHSKKPKLARVVGGFSGPAIKPVALRCVYECAQAVHIPIIGMGGITCADDAIEFLLAGATAVSVGTANFCDPYATLKIIVGINKYLDDNGVRDVAEIIGGMIC